MSLYAFLTNFHLLCFLTLPGEVADHFTRKL
jgi:hypothetical protein